MGKKKTKKQVEAEKAKQSQRLMGWTLGLILLLCVGAILYSAFSGPKTKSALDEAVFQYDQQPLLGSKDAPVRIVEFADFKCPSCRLFDQDILPLVKKDFIDTGIAQFYFINYPIVSPNGDSTTAAIAGEAVYNQNPEAFWSFYDAVFANQQDEKTTWATPDTLVQIARKANLPINFDQLKKDIEDSQFAEQVKGDIAIGNRAGVRGTPTLFINGKELPIQDTFNYEAFKAAILEAQNGSQ
ncbi:thioredoxin domain-containing protein [Ammoniphilus sp. YIM 78166]|uniref:DsbA family protein n=1 Tax=Ammoniphilus sp. YIM 78166 TaxID=1644106 RepID=UPI00106FF4F9|nr:thioredoxin domain-containing protein [Ammoniphilus sp. YIM 78166]